MPMKSTPAFRYKFQPSKKQLKESYEVRLAAQFGDRKAKEKLANYNRRVRERKRLVSEEEWLVHGKRFSRYQMMDYIVTMVSTGMSLPEVCEEPGMPTMLAVYSWFDNHPGFAREYARAEEVRGHILGERARFIGEHTDRENVTADKLKVDVLSKAAARSNMRFQDKQVVQTQDEYSSMTEEQLRAKVVAMVRANPTLSDLLPSSLGCQSSPERELPVLTLQPLDPAPGEIDTVEPEDSTHTQEVRPGE